MEKLSNSGTEPVNESVTLTYMVGQLPSPEKPYLNQLINNSELSVYILSNGSGEITLQVLFYQPITPERFKKYEQQFLEIVLGLMSQNVEYVVSWVPQYVMKLAELFGFEETGQVRAFRDEEGNPYILREMLSTFPELDDGTDS